MLIRTITDHDIEAVSKIYNDSWKASYKDLLPASFFNQMTYENSMKKWLSYIHEEGQGGFVALDDNNIIIGFAAYEPYDELENCLLLESLHILKTAQGKGMGKKLIYEVGKTAVENQYETLAISIIDGNVKAEAIYTHLGAKFYKKFIDDFDGLAVNSTTFLWDDLRQFT